jgi:hypothetical protein
MNIINGIHILIIGRISRFGRRFWGQHLNKVYDRERSFLAPSLKEAAFSNAMGAISTMLAAPTTACHTIIIIAILSSVVKRATV